jgi:hypothetical protein
MSWQALPGMRSLRPQPGIPVAVRCQVLLQAALAGGGTRVGDVDLAAEVLNSPSADCYPVTP